AAAQLRSDEARTLAYEIAVGVCDADKLRNESETRFLAQLGSALGLGQPTIATTAANTDALATVPLADDAAKGPVVAATASIGDAEMDSMILKASITNGALELLPQSLATMAVIPLQMRLVYRIGKAHGYELDRGHIKDLLATLGVGMTGQYLEQIGRKLLGGLLGRAAGGMIGSVARGATGAAFSFATTYAIGQVARRYYAGGRTMNTSVLKQSFDDLLQQGRTLQTRYVPQIEQEARTIDVNRLVQMVKERV
ncbi:MAG: YcjF family protein, partial [Burkholderiaceae bacterium]